MYYTCIKLIKEATIDKRYKNIVIVKIKVEQMEKTTVQQEFIKELNLQEDPTGFTFKAFEAGWNNKKKQFEL